MPRFRPALVLLLLFVTLPLAAASAVEDPESVGDRLWARRAEGFAAAHRVDPAIAEGVVQAYAGWRILGRLHTQVPKIPRFTDWVDRDQRIELLRRANAAAPGDPRNPLFLAEALLADRPEEKEQTLALLRGVAVRTPSPQALVEESEMVADARRLLAGAEAAP